MAGSNGGDSLTLLSNASATGLAAQWSGGAGVFSVEGTFNSGTVTLQYQSPNGTWINVGVNSALTTAGAAGFFLPQCPIRALVSGSPSALYAYAMAV